MEIISKETGRELTLTLRGELDHHGAKNVMQRMELALDAALPLKLILDFSGVRVIFRLFLDYCLTTIFKKR